MLSANCMLGVTWLNAPGIFARGDTIKKHRAGRECAFAQRDAITYLYPHVPRLGRDRFVSPDRAHSGDSRSISIVAP